MCGIKTIIALLVLGQFHASVKGRSFSQQTDSPCSPSPCFNKGDCLARTSEEGFGYSCLCPEGFSGKRCEITGCGDNSTFKVQCPRWAQIGECKKNPIWMKENCRKSCKHCRCGDNSEFKVQCPLWAQNGECKKNPIWMKENCRKSCKNCTSSCVDLHNSCPAWARLGECFKNKSYMMSNCKLSCKTC